MGDMGELYQSMRDHKKAIRAKYGVPCPECKRLQPRRDATILLPQQRCKVDGYRDPRNQLKDEQRSASHD